MALQEHLHARSNRLSLEYKLYHRLGNAGKHDVISKDNSNNNTVIVLILQQCNFVASLLVAVGWLNKIIYLWLSDWVAANQLHRIGLLQINYTVSQKNKTSNSWP